LQINVQIIVFVRIINFFIYEYSTGSSYYNSRPHFSHLGDRVLGGLVFDEVVHLLPSVASWEESLEKFKDSFPFTFSLVQIYSTLVLRNSIDGHDTVPVKLGRCLNSSLLRHNFHFGVFSRLLLHLVEDGNAVDSQRRIVICEPLVVYTEVFTSGNISQLLRS
jgi:hypothetical protein